MNSEDKPIIIGLGSFLAILVTIGALIVSGCTTQDREDIQAIVKTISADVEALRDAVPEESGPEAEPVPAPASASADVPLSWDFGGVNGSKSIEEPRAQIAGLKVSRSGMSYRWTAGGCEVFGASDRGDASKTIACLFYEKGGVYHGGKFDWISTSRVTRDLKNVSAGYGGWNASEFFAAKKFAFCIMDAKGKRRTNIITWEGSL